MKNMLNTKPLAEILRQRGFSGIEIEACINGYIPRVCGTSFTQAWKIRDAYIELAQHSLGERSEIPLQKVVEMVTTRYNSNDASFRLLSEETASIFWYTVRSEAGTFQLPNFNVPLGIRVFNEDAQAACRLLVLYGIWCLDPILQEIDFSDGIRYFSFESADIIQKKINEAIRKEAPNDDIARLIEVLRNGPRTRRELEKLLGIKRGVLLSRFLTPAIKQRFVEPVETGSSPHQKYRSVVKRH